METRPQKKSNCSIDHKAAGGRELHSVIKAELSGYLEYSNDVLPLYIVVMLARDYSEAMVAEDLDVFLGTPNAGHFAQW